MRNAIDNDESYVHSDATMNRESRMKSKANKIINQKKQWWDIR